MARKIEDVEKSMKRSNDKQLKVEHELCQKVCTSDLLFANKFLFLSDSNHVPEFEILLVTREWLSKYGWNMYGLNKLSGV